METVGNLPQGAARAFFAGLLKRKPAPVDLAKDWPEVYMVCGGNLGLLKHCLQSAASYQSLEPGAACMRPQCRPATLFSSQRFHRRWSRSGKLLERHKLRCEACCGMPECHWH